MTVALIVAGLAVVVVALIDLAWTTVAAGSGAGPISGRLAAGLWRAALAVHRRRPSHTFLSVAGVSTVFAVLALWIALVLAGWLLVFVGGDGAVRDSQSSAPADLVGRAYFVSYSVFTLGNGDYRPGAGLWQLATVLAAGTGLVVITLSITYLVPVASAVALRRQLASTVAALGRSPHEIVTTAWDGRAFTGLSRHLVDLGALVETSRQQHFTYPVLHYFHSRSPDSAAAPNLTNLTQALHLLRHGVAPEVRPAPAVLVPLERTLDAFLSTLRRAHLDPARTATASCARARDRSRHPDSRSRRLRRRRRADAPPSHTAGRLPHRRRLAHGAPEDGLRRSEECHIIGVSGQASRHATVSSRTNN